MKCSELLLERNNTSINIDTLIKNSKYSKRDIEYATEGLCGTFALALMHFLQSKHITSQLVIFVFDPTLYMEKLNSAKSHKRKSIPSFDDGHFCWQHVALQVGNNYYDIRGQIEPNQTHKEFTTDAIIPTSEEILLPQLKKLKNPTHYNEKKYDAWKRKWD